MLQAFDGDRVRAAIAHMGDERVTDVLRESQSAILKRFCPADVQAAIAPVNVRKREMSDLLAAQAETKQKQHERSISDVPRRILLTRPEESLYFDLRPLAVTTIVPWGKTGHQEPDGSRVA